MIHSFIIDILVLGSIWSDVVRIVFATFSSLKISAFGSFLIFILCLYVSTKTKYAKNCCVSFINYFFLTFSLSHILIVSAAEKDAFEGLGLLIVHFIFTLTVSALYFYSLNAKTGMTFIGAFRFIFIFHFCLLTLISILVEAYTAQMVRFSFFFTLLGLAINSGCSEFIKKRLYLKKRDCVLLSQRMYLMPFFMLINLDSILNQFNDD